MKTMLPSFETTAMWLCRRYGILWAIVDEFFFHLASSFRSHMIQVVLGEHSIIMDEGFEQKFNVSLVIRHYQYKHWTFDNDIMLIKVRDNCRVWHRVVTYTQFIQILSKHIIVTVFTSGNDSCSTMLYIWDTLWTILTCLSFSLLLSTMF